MAAGFVNIPRDVEDEFYRYTMPVLRVKVEGRGNGIKTLIENMSDIAKSLDRRPDYPTKFFGFVHGALTNVDAHADRYIVNGKHEAEDLAKTLDTFIEKFVLCRGCRNPETDMHIRGENIFLKCRACGYVSPTDASDKLTTYILKNPPVSKEKEKNKLSKQERKEQRKKAVELAREEEDDDDWAVPTTPEAVNERRLALLGKNDRLSSHSADDDKTSAKPAAAASSSGSTLVEMVPLGQNPIPALKKFWASEPSDQDVLEQVRALSEANKWSEANLFKILFGSLFDKDLKTNFFKKAHYLRLFVPTRQQQKLVLFCVEKLCQMEPTALTLVNSILYGFWRECLVDDEIVFKWYKHPSKNLPPKLSQTIRNESKAFVDWLESPEEETAVDDE